MALNGAGSTPGAPCVPENTIGMPGSMVIGARVPGGKLGSGKSKGTAALVLCTRSSGLDVEPRGGACAHVNNMAHCGARTKLFMVGVQRTPPRLVSDELTPLKPAKGLPH